jgi:hypothetical protein
MIKNLVFFLALAFVGAANAQSTPPQTFNAGGIPLVIPAPVNDMMEAGTETKKRLAALVPPSNRLLVAFIPSNPLSGADGKPTPGLTRYALAQVERAVEPMEIAPAQFAEIMGNIKAQYGTANVSAASLPTTGQDAKRQPKPQPIDTVLGQGKSANLGGFFSKPDAYGFGVVSDAPMGPRSMKMAMGGAVIRVKKKVVFIYLFTEYKKEDTVAWLRKATEQWADTLLAMNKK